MRINFANGTIEITNAEARRAGVINSEANNELNNILAKYPTFVLSVLSTTNKKTTKKDKVTLEDMRRYISTHDDENGTIMKELKARSKKKSDGELYGYNFFALKKWFFETYPHLNPKKDNIITETSNENKKGA